MRHIKAETFIQYILLVIWVSVLFSCNQNDQKDSKQHYQERKLKPSETIRFKIIEVIRIGEQIWMEDNLDVNVFNNGDTIFHARTKEQWEYAAEEQIPAWCYYNNSEINSIKNIDSIAKTESDIDSMHFEAGKNAEPPTEEDIKEMLYNLNKSIRNCGKLYNYYAAIDPRGLAPPGWRVPTKRDLKELKSYYGDPWQEGFTLNFTHEYWKKHSNKHGFKARPCGMRGHKGIFKGMTSMSRYWTLNSGNIEGAYNIAIFPMGGGGPAGDDYLNGVYIDLSNKGNGYAIRCIKE